jgi:hypothetical protein
MLTLVPLRSRMDGRRTTAMAKPPDQIELVISGRTPGEIPMGRLAAYLESYAALLGVPDRVRFAGIAEGSAVIRAAIDPDVFYSVRARLHDAQIRQGAEDAMRATDKLDRLLIDDGASAVVKPTGKRKRPLLWLLGATRDTDPMYGPITQEHSHVYGVPISVGGKQPLANVNLQDGETVHYCEAPRELALKIAPLLFHHRIRAHGVGRYMRGRDGSWWMESFRIHEFERLEERTLAETVNAMREDSARRPLDREILKKLAGLRRG